MADEVREILDIEIPVKKTKLTSTARSDNAKKQLIKKKKSIPPGMRRELYYLLCDEKQEDLPPLFPVDHGFKQAKAFTGPRRSSVHWKWVPFKSPARTDDAVFHHWQKDNDMTSINRFASFNKKVPIPTYTDQEYEYSLSTSTWTRAETDHLFELAERFDLRFVVMHDRWNRDLYPPKSIEDLKERYYYVASILEKQRYTFDADHERRRKLQLERIFSRTREQEEEINYLREELEKIRVKRCEREKKQQVLQELIQAAETETPRNKGRRTTKNVTWRNLHYKVKNSIDSSVGIKFREFKDCNIYPRSNTMRLPANISARKKQIIENKVRELNILKDEECYPIPTPEVCQLYNEVRSDIVLLHELQKGVSACEYELSLLKHECELMKSGVPTAERETSEIPDIFDDASAMPGTSTG